uniref:Uncharacterized protein n=1 Tax=Ananas comosus var. bracteatus TaxID=296719 RepID=A0A6V7PW57_ANACO|nr:unnamed protein product [Ananas comosus var. bracteatus]
MLSEARSLPCFHLIFDVATFESSIGSVKLDLEYSKYSRSSLTEPIDDSKVATSKTRWKHGRLRASDSIETFQELGLDHIIQASVGVTRCSVRSYSKSRDHVRL